MEAAAKKKSRGKIPNLPRSDAYRLEIVNQSKTVTQKTRVEVFTHIFLLYYVASGLFLYVLLGMEKLLIAVV